MCTPLMIAGAALSAASVGANTIANNQIQNARENAMEAERLRQQQFDQRASMLNRRSQDRYADFSGGQAKRASKLGEFFEGGSGSVKSRDGANDNPNKGGVLPASNSNITVAAENAGTRDAAQYASQQADALGQLRGFGDLMGSIGREQAQDATLVGQVGDFKRGSSAVLPYELEAANQKGGGLKLFADIAGGLGSVGMSAGVQGKNLFGAAAPGVAAGQSAGAAADAALPASALAAQKPVSALSPLWGTTGVPTGAPVMGGVPPLTSRPNLYNPFALGR